LQGKVRQDKVVHLRRPKLNSRGQVQRRRRDKSRRHAAMAGESRLLVREDTFACAAPERSKTRCGG